jgi:uncharacterized membrane protein
MYRIFLEYICRSNSKKKPEFSQLAIETYTDPNESRQPINIFSAESISLLLLLLVVVVVVVVVAAVVVVTAVVVVVVVVLTRG